MQCLYAWIVTDSVSCRLPDWTELFPLHKACCEGKVEGVRQCIQMGMSADERDTDTWTPLHYACWSVFACISIALLRKDLH